MTSATLVPISLLSAVASVVSVPPRSKPDVSGAREAPDRPAELAGTTPHCGPACGNVTRRTRKPAVIVVSCGDPPSRRTEHDVRVGSSVDGLGWVIREPGQLRSGSVFFSRTRLVRVGGTWGGERASRRVGAGGQLLVPSRFCGARGESLRSARQSAHRARRLSGRATVQPLAPGWPASSSTVRDGETGGLLARPLRGPSGLSHGPVRLRTDAEHAKAGEREANGGLPQAAVVRSGGDACHRCLVERALT